MTKEDDVYYDSLDRSTVRFRLKNPEMNNREIAEQIGAKCGIGDPQGSPRSIFYMDVYPAAIRTSREEVAVFRLYRNILGSIMEGAGVASQIIETEQTSD